MGCGRAHRVTGSPDRGAVWSPVPDVDGALDHMEVVVRPGWCSRPVPHAIVG